MKIPFKSTKNTLVDEIAQKILSQEDRLVFLTQVLGKLPPELVKWTIGWYKTELATKSYEEIDIAETVNIPILTGDIVIKKFRNPNPRDIVDVVWRYQDSKDYGNRLSRVVSVDIQKSLINVEDYLDPKQTASLYVTSILYIIDKIIPYGSAEWETTAHNLNIDYSHSEIKTWISKSIEIIEKMEDFFEKEKTIKQLKERLELAIKNDKK